MTIRLGCPACRTPLVGLSCPGCGAEYVERDGVPVLLPNDVPVEQQRTAEAFASEWLHFDELHPEYEEQFLDWIKPLDSESFRSKRVLDAGCGTGRHAFLAHRYGARELLAVDLGESVRTAQQHIGGNGNVTVVQGDLHRLPLPADDPGFDVVYCIGVLHHLPEPRAGLLALARQLAPGGELLVWVYGYEGNALVRHAVDPLRRLLTRRASYGAIRALSLPLALVLHGLARTVYSLPLGRKLPMGAYVSTLSRFSFRQVHSIVYDQLVAPTSHYVRELELREWLSAAGLHDVEVTRRTGNSWRGYGRR